jgi:prepilin-type N-terminal cleavage/methylation domain-containing protein
MPRRSRKRFGFTLIELMITVSIIGILASIAIPKFSDMVRKSREGTLKGQLGAIRSALAIYYADTEGNYPTGNCPPPPGSCMGVGSDVYMNLLQWLTVNGKYLTTISAPLVPDYHMQGAFNGVTDYDLGGAMTPSPSYFFSYDPSYVDSSDNYGAWIYFFDPTQPGSYGQVFVMCNHTDTKGTQWSSY